jgi:hypothetical protein
MMFFNVVLSLWRRFTRDGTFAPLREKVKTAGERSTYYFTLVQSQCDNSLLYEKKARDVTLTGSGTVTLRGLRLQSARHLTYRAIVEPGRSYGIRFDGSDAADSH